MSGPQRALPPQAAPARGRERGWTSDPRTLPVVIAGFTAFLDLYATQPLLPYLARLYDASAFEVSLTITAPTVAVALAAPVVGRLADRFGLRTTIAISAYGLAATSLAASTAGSLPQLIGWRFVQGLVTPGVFAVVIAYVHQEWPPARASGVTAAYVGGTVVGGFVGRMLAGVVSAAWGWPPAFIVLGAVNLIAAAAIVRLLRDDHPRARTHASAAGVRASLRDLLANRQIVAAYVVGSALLGTQMAAFTYVTFHLAAPPFLLSTAALGWLFATYLPGAAITPLAGRWIDRYGRRAAFLVAGAIGVGAAAFTLVPALWAILPALALLGTSVFVGQSAASSHVAANAPARSRALALGVYSTCYYAGGSVGGALPALFWDRGGWTACVGMIVAAQFGMLATVWSLWADAPARA